MRRSGDSDKQLLSDALGSVVGLADEGGWLTDEYAYSAFGKSVHVGADDANSLGFTGREDDGTGLYYYRARYYDPGLKRFVSADPIGLLGGINTYSYVGGNPALYRDPTGLATARDFQTAIDLLRERHPSVFPKLPHSVTSADIDSPGMTDFFDNITVDSDLYGDNQTPVDEFAAEEFINTVAHEMLHVNEPWYERALSNGIRMNNPLGILHRQLDERARELAKDLWKEFLIRRKNPC